MTIVKVIVFPLLVTTFSKSTTLWHVYFEADNAVYLSYYQFYLLMTNSFQPSSLFALYQQGIISALDHNTKCNEKFL